MIILDTDHITILSNPGGEAYACLTQRMAPFATTIVTTEEHMRGWLAAIHRRTDFEDPVDPYARLQTLFSFFSRWEVLPFDADAARECRRLRKLKVRIGTRDLKIAAIALVNHATLLSDNRRDFERVPDLVVESWLH